MKILNPAVLQSDVPQWGQVEKMIGALLSSSNQAGLVEQIHHQVLIPANSLRSGAGLRVLAYTQFPTAIGAITPKLRFGTAGTTADTQIGNVTSAASLTPILNHAIRVEFLSTMRAVGASGVASITTNMLGLSGNSAVVAGQQANLATAVTTGIDTTVDNYLSFSMAQATGGSAVVTQCQMELV